MERGKKHSQVNKTPRPIRDRRRLRNFEKKEEKQVDKPGKGNVSVGKSKGGGTYWFPFQGRATVCTREVRGKNHPEPFKKAGPEETPYKEKRTTALHGRRTPHKKQGKGMELWVPRWMIHKKNN